MKLDFDYYEYSGKEYEFLSDSLEYLKMINLENKQVNYSVLKKIFISLINEQERKINQKYKFEFIDEIREEVKDLIGKNQINNPEISRLKTLFSGYPVYITLLYKDLN